MLKYLDLIACELQSDVRGKLVVVFEGINANCRIDSQRLHNALLNTTSQLQLVLDVYVRKHSTNLHCKCTRNVCITLNVKSDICAQAVPIAIVSFVSWWVGLKCKKHCTLKQDLRITIHIHVNVNVICNIWVKRNSIIHN